jgi:hypothetical protein
VAVFRVAFRAVKPLSISIIAVNYFNKLCQGRFRALRAAAANPDEFRFAIGAGRKPTSVPAGRSAIPGRRVLTEVSTRSGDPVE